MKFGPFKEGLEILSKYVDPDGYVLQAQRDQIWLGPGSADAVSSEDAARLEDLGWFIDEDSWSCFT